MTRQQLFSLVFFVLSVLRGLALYGLAGLFVGPILVSLLMSPPAPV